MKQNLVPIGFANNYRDKQKLQQSHHSSDFSDDTIIDDISNEPTSTKSSKNRKLNINRQKPVTLPNQSKKNKVYSETEENSISSNFKLFKFYLLITIFYVLLSLLLFIKVIMIY